jgi:hypothetical protein
MSPTNIDIHDYAIDNDIWLEDGLVVVVVGVEAEPCFCRSKGPWCVAHIHNIV